MRNGSRTNWEPKCDQETNLMSNSGRPKGSDPYGLGVVVVAAPHRYNALVMRREGEGQQVLN